jgi:hypothetical protein
MVANENSFRTFTRNCVDAQTGFGDKDMHEALLVVKSDGSLLKISTRDVDAVQNMFQIKKDDGVHLAWEKFESIEALEGFLVQRKTAFEAANVDHPTSKPGYVILCLIRSKRCDTTF